MSETILIPYYDPENEVLESYPDKIVFHEDYIEVFSKNSYISQDEDEGLKTEKRIDYTSVVLKKFIHSIEMGKNIKNDSYMVKYYFADRLELFQFKTKAEAKEIYTKLYKWFLCK